MKGAPEMPEPRIRLVCRMDDAGSCRSANEAVEEVLDRGYARNVSVMACCPAFDEAAEMLRRHPDACVGVHLTLNAEWDAVKWPPVLPADRVGSLVDDDGMLLPHPRANHERGADPDEVLAEMTAQLARMRDAGLDVKYMDEHMGFDWLDGVAERLEGLARREGLLRGRGTVRPLPGVEGRFEDVGDEIVARVAAAAPGTYLLVGHPGYDRPDMQAFGHEGQPPGSVARDRVRQRLGFLSPKVADYAAAHAVQFARYTDVLTLTLD